MNLFDYFIIITGVVFIGFGLFMGLIRQVFLLAGVVVGVLLAVRYNVEAAVHIPVGDESLRAILAFAGVLLDQSLPGISVASAGLWAGEGEPADAAAQRVAVRFGIDLDIHRTHRVT